MFRQLLAFEWEYHTRQVSFWVGVVLFFLMGLQFGSNFGADKNVFMNAPVKINHLASLMSMSGIFVVMVFSANAMLRDSDHKMSELVFATSINKWHLLSSRFFGVVGAAFLVMTSAMLGALVITLLPVIDPESLGPIRPLYYIWSLFVFILPSLFFSAALIFSIAALSRSMMATYLSAVVIYVLYVVGAMLGGSPMLAGATPTSPEAMAFAAMVDPFAITTFYEQTQFWTPTQQNQQMIQLEGNFLFNRLLFIGLGGLILMGLISVFKLQMPKQKLVKEKMQKRSDTKDYQYRVLSPMAGMVAQRAAFLSSLKLELALVLKSKPFIAMIIIWCVVIFSELFSAVAFTEYGSPSYSITALLLSSFQFDVLPRFGFIFIVYYAAEIFWRERAVNINHFVDSSPVSSPVLFSAKFIALLMVPMTMIASSIVISIIFQLLKGHGDFELSLYFSLFYYGGLPLVCVAVLALLMQSISANKYMGMALTVLVIVTTTGIGAAALGLNHPMFHFSKVPVLNYSGMDGYQEASEAFGWYMLYWGSLSAVFALISFVLWPRGNEHRFLFRLKQLSLRGQKPAMKMALTASLCLFVYSGGYIFNQTNGENIYQTEHEQFQRLAEYENTLKPYKNLAQPIVTGLTTHVDLFPSKRSFKIQGEYVLTNKTDKTINRLLVTTHSGQTKSTVSVKSAKSSEHNERLGTYWFDLSKPMMPRQTVTMDFELSAHQSGFVSNGSLNKVLENGSIMMMRRLMPTIGYRSGREINSKSRRSKLGLPPKTEAETMDEAIARKKGDFSDEYLWIDYETTISTAIDQTAISQGQLVKQWQENGRQYFHYKSEQPILSTAMIHSARYAVKKVLHNGVNIEVYYNENQGRNIDRMIEATQDSLDYFSTHFGPYQHDHLRITQVPVGHRERFTGYASAGNIMFTTKSGFITNLEKNVELDQVYRRVAHEVAHQWWGHQLDPASIDGNLVMIETLAKYSEARILENQYDKDHVTRLVAYESRRYLRGRANESNEEMPLYKVRGNQKYVMYSKGAYVMNRLYQQLGEATMNRLMVNMLDKYAYPNKPATSLDFINELNALAPASMHEVIDEMMTQIVIYDFAVDSASYKKLDDDRYRVDVTVKSAKFKSDGFGAQTAMAMNEQIEIGIFDEYPGSEGGSEGLILLKENTVKGDSNQFSFIVDKVPAYIVIDPNYYRIDNSRQNNIERVAGE